jgi:hypothetical protein
MSELTLESWPAAWTKSNRRSIMSVRRLIILVLVIGAAMGWVCRSARIQRETVAAIKMTDGSVCYDWEYNDGDVVSDGKPWGPKWLIGLVTEVSDAGLMHLKSLTNLEVLRLSGSKVTDAGIKAMRRVLPKLANDEE